MTLVTNFPLPWESQPYSVMRHGLTITNCDMEPVQTPGCVQAHGVLLVLRLADLSILQASDNVQAIFGMAVGDLLGQPIGKVIGPGGQARLLDMLTTESTDRNPLYLLTLPGRHNGVGALDVTTHTADGVVILEFESTGRTDAADRLARFIALYPKLFADPAQAPVYVDLRYADGFAVRMPRGAPPVI